VLGSTAATDEMILVVCFGRGQGETRQADRVCQSATASGCRQLAATVVFNNTSVLLGCTSYRSSFLEQVISIDILRRKQSADARLGCVPSGETLPQRMHRMHRRNSPASACKGMRSGMETTLFMYAHALRLRMLGHHHSKKTKSVDFQASRLFADESHRRYCPESIRRNHVDRPFGQNMGL
jgi:hypothetical protein